MAKRRTSGKRAQGAGRTPNSEPRFQVFRDFAGCNFQNSPRDFTLGVDADREEQSDLQMNYVVIQNNAAVEANKTIETRNNLVKLFDAPDGKKFTDASVLIADELYIATADGDIAYGSLEGFAPGDKMSSFVTLTNNTGSGHSWESLDYYDGKLIGATSQNELWMGAVASHTIANAREVQNPSAPTIEDNLVAHGSLELSATMTQACTFRTDIAYTYVNKYGPTKTSDRLTFYSNVPVSEWHAGCYLQIKGSIPQGYDIKAVELYYSADNASTLLFMGRTDVTANASTWSFSWLGYLDATSMWPMGNLIAPTENYTKGVPVSRMRNIDGRMYFWGDKSMPYRLYIGGNPGNLFSVSPGTGGGFVDVEPGTGQEIRYVSKYKTQSGASIVTMLCDSKNSMKEQRFNLVENSITVSNEQSMKSWQSEQVAGAVGCKSYHGAKVCEDGLYSVSRYGLALTTMTMEYNSQIRANYVSDPIKPVFTDTVELGKRLRESVLLEADGVIYLAFGSDTASIDNILFCYDIDLKAWWTYTLDIDEAIIDMIHIDYEGYREGIGIVTQNSVYLLPTTQNDGSDEAATFEFLIETGELSAQQPQQSWVYLSQMEFRFDWFVGDMEIQIIGIDQFGRKVDTRKTISHGSVVYDDAEYMRVDLRLQSYKLILRGTANFRMTHFISKVYTMSNKRGLVWGFDDRQSYRSIGDIHPTFKTYNDIRKAIIP